MVHQYHRGNQKFPVAQWSSGNHKKLSKTKPEFAKMKNVWSHLWHWQPKNGIDQQR
jgi:hypothetical protein